MKCEVLVGLVANLTVVMVLMRSGLRYVSVVLCIFIYVVLPMFSKVFIVFSFSLLLDPLKFFSHEFSLTLIDYRTETIRCTGQIKAENVEFGL